MPIKKHSPYKIVQMFEEEVAEYTRAPYAVSVDIPSKTYLSVPMSIIHAGGEVVFDKTPSTNHWNGIYQLKPYPIYDAAKRFTSNMYIKGSYMCLSFHIKKSLGIGKGGMILTDNKESVEWFKRARYEGRSEKYYKEDNITSMGWNMYMTPQEATQGLCLMQNYPEHASDMMELNGYRDLTEFEVFKKCKVI